MADLKVARYYRLIRGRRNPLSLDLLSMKMGDVIRRVSGVAKPRTIVTLHHLACSGGTIMTKCLAAMPGAMVLSEIHPDRPILPEFHPLSQLWRGYGELFDPLDRSVIRGHFRREIVIASAIARSLDRQLIVRDHSHTDFAWRGLKRSTLVDELSKEFQVKSIVTVRDPREVWLSLRREGWFDGTPDDLCNAHLALLEAFPDSPVFRYEDFVDQPERIVSALCEAAGVPFLEGFEARLEAVAHLTGDSGRSSEIITRRPPKALSTADREAFERSSAYHSLMRQLGVRR